MSLFFGIRKSPSRTKLFVPAWWVQSYEEAVVSEKKGRAFFKGRSAFDPELLNWQQRVALPFLSAFQWAVLPFVFSDIQQQCLSHQGGRLDQFKLDFRELLSSIGLSRSFQKRESLQLFSMLKDLRLSSGRSKDSMSLIFSPLFQSEEWLLEQDSFQLSLRPNEFCEEFLFGYRSSYEQLLRALHKKQRELDESPDRFMTARPLCLSKSVWLDLKGIEQVLFLRLEKARQWDEDTVLDLKGVYGKDMEVLFEGLSFWGQGSEPRRGSFPYSTTKSPLLPHGSFVAKMKILQKLSSKLMQHGLWTSNRDPHSYLAFPRGLESPLWIWKEASGREDEADQEEHRDAAASVFLRKTLLDKSGDFRWLNPVTLGLSSQFVHEFVQTLRTKIDTSPQALKELSGDSLVIEKNLLIPVFLLYIEWFLRSRPGSLWPIPYDLHHSHLFKPFLSKDIVKGSFLDGFVHFKAALKGDRHQIVSILEQNPYATLVSSASRHSSTFSKFSEDFAQIHLKPTAVIKTEATRKPFSSSTSSPSKKENAAPTSRQNALKKLDMIRSQSADSYSRLVQDYISSLEEPARGIILDVQKHMQPHLFDEHLKTRLLGFLIENPAKSLDLGFEGSLH
ncbi:MAG: hypothetical protein KA436_06885 [Oligoflexales bacterium]|nr:hypothetical protein [Oligoflexales bacterium]